jgi:RNA polymerase sigma-70 factor, ECF subfamily
MPRKPVEPPSDEHLAILAQEGCVASFEQLMRRFQIPLLHYLQQRGGPFDAEDLIQETFLRAYTNLHRYRPKWKFATWLFTIGRRLSINHHRRTRPETGCRELALAVSAGDGPVEAAIREETRCSLWTAAAEVLSEEEHTALWLHYVEEMPVREIARVLERSRVSVKTMMFRARKKLLPLLTEMVGGEQVPGKRESQVGSVLSEPACAVVEANDV